MTAQKTKPTQKRLNNCVLSPLRWAKIYEKLENCACGTLKIKDAVANAAVRVANAPKKGRARRNTMLLGKYPLDEISNFNSSFRRPLRQSSDLARNHREPLTSVAGTRSFYGCVQGEQIGLRCDIFDGRNRRRNFL